MKEEVLLLDVPLVPDPDADKELAGQPEQAIADADLKGCRILITQQAIETISLQEVRGGFVQLSCIFQPTAGIRFSYAQFLLQLQQPKELIFWDIAPKLIDDPNPVEITIDRKGSIALKSSSFPIEPGIERGISKKYTRYHCKVQGTGVSTSQARWDFRENPDRKDGIGLEQVLSFILPWHETITLNAFVGARVCRTGLKGALDTMRDVIAGPLIEGKHCQFQLQFG